MQVSCPHCSKTFEPERAGVQFCPHCGGQLDVPAASVSAPAGGGVAPPSASPPFGGGASPGGMSGAPSGGGGLPPGGDVAPAWERRQALGFASALFQTVKDVLTSPQVFWSTVRPDASMSDALWYAWIIAAAAAVIRLPFSYASRASVEQVLAQLQSSGNSMPPQVQELVTRYGSLLAGGGIASSIGALVFAPLSLVISAAILHVCGLVTGGASQGFGATFRVVCYASTPTLFGGLHGCVMFIVLIYQLVLLAMGMEKVHRTTAGKAWAAVLAPVLLLCVCCCAVAAIAGIFGALASKGS